MSFLELVGAILVFGLAVIYVPRVAFVVTLAVALHLFGFHFLFWDVGTPFFWEGVASIALVIAFLISLFFDWYHRDNTHEQWFG
ncbi:MAG: hypothetical protein WCW78_02660 [Candidatus Paceibacterota bacterium]|jgi:hypothetical protein